MADTFQVDPLYGDEHTAGNADCHSGWCSGREGFHPRPCVCGGLVHAEFFDEDADDNYILTRRCDLCGEDYEEVD